MCVVTGVWHPISYGDRLPDLFKRLQVGLQSKIVFQLECLPTCYVTPELMCGVECFFVIAFAPAFFQPFGVFANVLCDFHGTERGATH